MTLPRFSPLALLLVSACFGGGDTDSEPISPDAGASVDAAPALADARQGDPDARPPLKPYGEPCTDGSQCQGSWCVGPTEAGICTRTCNASVPHDCNLEDAFCVPLSGGDHACYGSIDVGLDTDEAILLVNDAVTRGFHNLTDIDMFPIHVNQNKDLVIQADPEAFIDVELVLYNQLAEVAAIASDAPAGEVEGILYEDAQIGNVIFAVVKNIGTSTGNYTIRVVEYED